MTVPVALAVLFPHATSARPTSATMDRHERPFWAAVIRIVRDSEERFQAAILGCAIALFLMMAIGTLAAWQSGTWATRPAARGVLVTTVLPAPAGAAGAR